MACTGNAWTPETSFVNMVEVIKNYCGTSFGSILRHPRCADVNRDKISRESIERFKAEFIKLSEEERKNLCEENKSYLKEFDQEADQLQFHHLPQKSMPLQFTLTEEMSKSEIMDYALVSCDSPDDLKIQSLFNFNYQKFTVMRLTTILLDTLSCFMGLGKETPLSSSVILTGKLKKIN